MLRNLISNSSDSADSNINMKQVIATPSIEGKEIQIILGLFLVIDIYCQVVYDRNHLFGLGPIPKLNIWP
jgi:hypothetical protein